MVKHTCHRTLQSPTASYNLPVTAHFTRPPLRTTHLSQQASLAHRFVQLTCHSTRHSPPPPPRFVQLTFHSRIQSPTAWYNSPVTACFTLPPFRTTHLPRQASIVHRFVQLTCHITLLSLTAWYNSPVTARSSRPSASYNSPVTAGFTRPPLVTTHLSQQPSLAHRLVQLTSHSTLHSPTASYNSPVTAGFNRPPLGTTHQSQHASLAHRVV